MVDFVFINGHISQADKEEIQEKFLEGLAEFRKEFEANYATVTINLRADRNTPDFSQFVFADKNVNKLADFILRFQLAYPSKDK